MMAVCRKISMTRFTKMQTFEIEFATKKIEKFDSYCCETTQKMKKRKFSSTKSLFGKKSNRNKLFLSKKLANSLKKVRLRRKEKSANNNFLYEKKNSLINDEELKHGKTLPIIPFSPNHLIESLSPQLQKPKQKQREISLDQLSVWNIEKRKLEHLIHQARTELYTEGLKLDNYEEIDNLDDDYVDVYDNKLHQSDVGDINDDYVDMNSLTIIRSRLNSL